MCPIVSNYSLTSCNCQHLLASTERWSTLAPWIHLGSTVRCRRRLVGSPVFHRGRWPGAGLAHWSSPVASASRGAFVQGDASAPRCDEAFGVVEPGWWVIVMMMICIDLWYDLRFIWKAKNHHTSLSPLHEHADNSKTNTWCMTNRSVIVLFDHDNYVMIIYII